MQWTCNQLQYWLSCVVCYIWQVNFTNKLTRCTLITKLFCELGQERVKATWKFKKVHSTEEELSIFSIWVIAWVKIIPYQWFRYALLDPTVARVHFLNLKPLVCILISTGSTWDIGTKCWYVLPQGFESWMCTLTTPTICTIDIVTKVVGAVKQWHDCLANKNPDTPDTTHIVPKVHMHTMTLLLPTPSPVHIAASIFRCCRFHCCSYPPPRSLQIFY